MSVSGMGVDTLPPPPPPPPVPPSPPALRPIPNVGTEESSSGSILPEHTVTKVVSSHTLGCEAYKQLQRQQSCFVDLTRYCHISVYRPVRPILQNGPECGIVALAMSAPLLGKPCIETEHIINRSKQLNLSKQGEIFSVDYMTTLAQDVLQCSAAVVDVVEDSEQQQVLKNLLQGAVLLIPYDSDKNHRPCSKKGHKAHWAVISGFFLAVNNEFEATVHSLCSPDPEHCGLYHCSSPSSLLPLQPAMQCVAVYAQQGKSRYPGVWLLQDLLSSNLNLRELDPSRAAEADSYVIPPGGVLEGLCGRAVVLSKD